MTIKEAVMREHLSHREVSIGALAGLPYEAVKWELLRTAITLGVFDCLSVPRTAEDAASDLATHPTNTEHLLNALVTLGCLSKLNGCFVNTSLAETFLTADKDTSVGESLLFMDNWIRPVLDGGMLDLVRNGPSKVEPVDSEAVWEAGAWASLNHSRCGRAQRLAAYVAALPEFPSFSRILDLGAGPGIIGIAVTAAHPTLRCFLVDRPAVCKVAEAVVAEYGLQYRIQTIRADYMNDPFGSDYDFIMANYTLNFYRDRLDEIVGKVYQALTPGGVFMVTSDALTQEKTAPAATVMSWLPTWLQGTDMSFERGVITNAMREAGFVSTESQLLDDIELEAHGPVDLIVGRKGAA
jgi:SAM-dependent methyltransferase